MATKINADTVVGGAVVTADASGILELQSAGTTALTLSGANATFATAPSVTGGAAVVTATGAGTSGQVLTSAGVGGTPTWTTISSSVQYPQNIQTGNYTLVLSDAGKQIFHPASDPFLSTYTIPANSSVPFPTGTVFMVAVENGGGAVNVNINTDTLIGPTGVAGPVAVPQNTIMAFTKITSTKWMANFYSQNATYTFLVGYTATTTRINAYPWSSVTGFGDKYANPSSAPVNTVNGVAFSPSGNALVAAHIEAPYVAAYAWSLAGFGSRYADPATTPTGWGRSVAFNPQGTAVAVGHDTSPYVSVYAWSGSGFGAKFSDPATLPTGSGNGVSFSPAGNAIAIAHNTSPYITAYPWSVSGFGVKYANPATLPTNNGQAVTFSPTGDAVAVGHVTSPYLSVYPWSSATGFGTKYANPASLPSNNVSAVAFSRTGDALAVGHAASPFLSAYPWSSATGFGTKYAAPATVPSSDVRGLVFSAANDAILMANSGASSVYMTAYKWTPLGFGSRYPTLSDANQPGGPATSAAFTVNP